MSWIYSVTSKALRVRLGVVAVGAILMPLSFNYLSGTPHRLQLGYPAVLGISAAWSIFYAGWAALLSVLTAKRTIAIALFSILVPTVGLFARYRIAEGIVLVAAALVGGFVSMRRRSARPRLGQTTKGVLLVTGLLTVVAAYVAGRTDASEAASAVAPANGRVIDVLHDAMGQRAVVLMAQGTFANLNSSAPGLVSVRRAAPGYWIPISEKTGGDKGRGSGTFFRPFKETCRGLSFYAMSADAYGVCMIETPHVVEEPASWILTGLAPRNATMAIASLADGRLVENRLRGEGLHGYAFWGADVDVRQVERVSFQDSSGRLLDARVGPRRFDVGQEGFARLAAGCVRDTRCPIVNDRFIVSVSLLRPDEFRSACAASAPRGDWTVIASVFVGTHETGHYPGRDGPDRRLLGTSIHRFAAGRGATATEPAQPLPTMAEPCFPLADNVP